MRTQRRISVVPGQIRRRNHELEALGVGGRSASTDIHVPATDPFSAGRDPDLVARTVVANRRACRVGAVTVIVAGRHCVGAAGTTAAVNSVVPIEVMIGVEAVPTAILGFEGVMGPTHAGIQIAHNHALAGEAEGPDPGSIDIHHAPLGCVRNIRDIRRDLEIGDLGWFNPAGRPIGIDARHIRARRERLDQSAARRRDNHIGDPE